MIAELEIMFLGCIMYMYADSLILILEY